MNSLSSLAMVCYADSSLQNVANPCAGIWDCLTSQQCVDVVRRLISEGKELSEIAENVCELCLAPDTESGAGIGCDNMTMLVIAILNGKTTEEWRTWVTDRVKNGVGHPTPDALPQLYSQSRLMAFKAKRAAEEAREKDRQTRLGGTAGPVGFGSTGFGITRILGSNGGISFRSGGGALEDSGALMFGDDDTESDDSDDMNDPESRSFFSHTFGYKRNYDPNQTDSANESLKKQLAGLEQPRDGKKGDSSTSSQPNGKAEASDDIEVDTDQDSLASEPPTSPLPHKTETPPPPKPLPNGDTIEQNPPQFTALPGSDEAAPVVKVEGLMDTSEDPLKG